MLFFRFLPQPCRSSLATCATGRAIARHVRGPLDANGLSAGRAAKKEQQPAALCGDGRNGAPSVNRSTARTGSDRSAPSDYELYRPQVSRGRDPEGFAPTVPWTRAAPLHIRLVLPRALLKISTTAAPGAQTSSSTVRGRLIFS